MSSNPTPQQVRAIQQAESAARLEQKNKEAAKVHLLQIQAILARTIPDRKR